MKAPSTNTQAPEKIQISNIKNYRGVLLWSLRFGTSLDVGAWNLEL
jgi:hypothetical protein